jgi:hypothetical protein
MRGERVRPMIAEQLRLQCDLFSIDELRPLIARGHQIRDGGANRSSKIGELV